MSCCCDVSALPEASWNLVRSGAILRGNGPPLPTLADPGKFYLDTGTRYLYLATESGWGVPFATVPTGIAPTLRFYGNALPVDAIGNPGDYYLSLFQVYGTGDVVYIGPKAAHWPP